MLLQRKLAFCGYRSTAETNGVSSTLKQASLCYWLCVRPVGAGGGGGRREGGERNLEQLLQVTFMSLPEGNLSFFIFVSLSPYAIVIDPYCTKSLFSSNSKDLLRSKSFSILCVHTLPSHYVFPFAKLIGQCCNGFPQLLSL